MIFRANERKYKVKSFTSLHFISLYPYLIRQFYLQKEIRAFLVIVFLKNVFADNEIGDNVFHFL